MGKCQLYSFSGDSSSHIWSSNEVLTICRGACVTLLWPENMAQLIQLLITKWVLRTADHPQRYITSFWLWFADASRYSVDVHINVCWSSPFPSYSSPASSNSAQAPRSQTSIMNNPRKRSLGVMDRVDNNGTASNTASQQRQFPAISRRTGKLRKVVWSETLYSVAQAQHVVQGLPSLVHHKLKRTNSKLVLILALQIKINKTAAQCK